MFANTDERVVAFKIHRAHERFGAYCSVHFPGIADPPMFDCVLDTGSTRIVVPQRHWKDHVPSPETLTGRRIRA